MIKLTDKLQELSNKVFRFIPQPTPSIEKLKAVKIVAHRGDWNNSDRLENTLEAYDFCVDKNIWAIEFDIRWSKDNVPMVHHDASTLRVFGKDRLISDMNLSEVKNDFPKIPELSEVINRYGKKLHFMIELKATQSPEQAEILKEALGSLTPIDDFHFLSLDLNRFNNLNFVPKKSFVSVARTNISKIHASSLKQEIGALTGQYLLLSNKMKDQCHKQGLKVGTGFPDSKNLFFREVGRGVDWVFTNHAVNLAKLLPPS